MTSRQYYYPRVVLQLYHSMTSLGVASPLELRFSIDDCPGVLRTANISAMLGLQIRRPIQRLSRLGPPTSAGDGSHSGPRHYSRTSALQEAVPASDAPSRSLDEDQPFPAAALCTTEGGHPGGSLPGSRRDTGLVPLSW